VRVDSGGIALAGNSDGAAEASSGGIPVGEGRIPAPAMTSGGSGRKGQRQGGSGNFRSRVRD
jgi:hypothetical protein